MSSAVFSALCSASGKRVFTDDDRFALAQVYCLLPCLACAGASGHRAEGTSGGGGAGSSVASS